jgi:uncharacterized protein YijF (DUF1287 family)
MTRQALIRRAGLMIFGVLAGALPGSAAGAGFPPGVSLVRAARRQIGKTLVYDPVYAVLKYPMGDVPEDRGVCSDVVIRALRENGADLQQLVHEDMKAHFSAYPKTWGLKRTDRNIDHRRVLNLAVFFKRRGLARPISRNPTDYGPGDLVTCTVAGNLPHIMMVSDRANAHGVPLIIHNIGQGTREEDRLFDFPINGHFRWK